MLFLTPLHVFRRFRGVCAALALFVGVCVTSLFAQEADLKSYSEYFEGLSESTDFTNFSSGLGTVTAASDALNYYNGNHSVEGTASSKALKMMGNNAGSTRSATFTLPAVTTFPSRLSFNAELWSDATTKKFQVYAVVNSVESLVGDFSSVVLKLSGMSGQTPFEVCLPSGTSAVVFKWETNVTAYLLDALSLSEFVGVFENFNLLTNDQAVTELETDLGTLTADSGFVKGTTTHADGAAALWLNGDAAQRSMTIALAETFQDARWTFSFNAERVSSSMTFNLFAIYAVDVNGAEREIFNNASIAVASTVTTQSFSCIVPVNTRRLTIKWTGESGAIVDNFKLEAFAGAFENFNLLTNNQAVTELETDLGTLTADSGFVKGTTTHADGVAALWLNGAAAQRSMTIALAEIFHDRKCIFSFNAERVTNNSNFTLFAIYAVDADGTEREIFDGTSSVTTVGANGNVRDLSFSCLVPANTRSLTVKWTGESGAIVDNFKLVLLEDIEISDVTASADQWPALARLDRNAVMKLEVTATGEVFSGTQLFFSFAGTTNIGDIEYAEIVSSTTTNAELQSGATAVSARVVPDGDGSATFTLDGLPAGNLFLSVKLKDDADIDGKLVATFLGAKNSAEDAATLGSEFSCTQRIGYALAKPNDDIWRGDVSEISTNWRIPGIASGENGKLVAVFDARYTSGADLGATPRTRIDIASIVSEDGGKSWGVRNRALRWTAPDGVTDTIDTGVGDPAILFDPETKTFWLAGLTGRGLSSGNYDPKFIMAKSTDGVTWTSVDGTAEYDDITSQVKRDEWQRCIFQGPGHGITMRDGTLVFPTQVWAGSSGSAETFANIIYSKDGGHTWICEDKKNGTTGAALNIGESTVAELSEDGVLMLNVRNQAASNYRSVHTTNDLGETWVAHSTHDNTLVEPGACQGSLFSVRDVANGGVRDALFFSNPNSTSGRNTMTLKLSLDDGTTWRRAVLYDARTSAGYSDLCMADDTHVGVIYEYVTGSNHIAFLRIPVSEILPKFSAVSEKRFAFEKASSSGEIAFTTDSAWSLESDAEWLGVSGATSGSASDEEHIAFTVSENTGEATRTATLTLRATGADIGLAPIVFTVTQYPNPRASFGEGTGAEASWSDVSSLGTEKAFSVTANVPAETIEILSSDDTWLSATLAEDGTLTVSVEANESFDARDGTLTLRYGETELATLSVSQLGKANFEVVASGDVPAAGSGEFELAVTSNRPWKVTGVSAGWLTLVSPESGVEQPAGTGRVVLAAASNASAVERSGEISFSWTDGDKSASTTLTVTQSAAAASASFDEGKGQVSSWSDVVSTGTERAFPITTNISDASKFSELLGIEIPDAAATWLSARFEDGALVVTVAANTEEAEREATISIVRADGGEVLAEFSVSQLGKACFEVVVPDDVPVAGAENFALTVTSNRPWKVTAVSADWLTLVSPESGVEQPAGTGSVVLAAASNASAVERSGEISFSWTDGDESASTTQTVRQSAAVAIASFDEENGQVSAWSDVVPTGAEMAFPITTNIPDTSKLSELLGIVISDAAATWLSARFEDGSLIVTVEENPDRIVREATISIVRAGVDEVLAEFSVSQLGKAHFDVAASGDVPAAGSGEFALAVTSNRPWKVTAVSADWMTLVSPESGAEQPAENGSVVLAVEKNAVTVERSGEISFSWTDGDESASTTLTVTQSAAAAIASFDKENGQVSAWSGIASMGAERTFPITTNIPDTSKLSELLGIVIPDAAATWLSARFEDGALVVAVAANTEQEDRKATISIVRADGGEVLAEFSVAQGGEPYFVANVQTPLPSEGGDCRLEISSNAKWELEGADSLPGWLNVVSPTSGKGSAALTLRVAANGPERARSKKLVFRWQEVAEGFETETAETSLTVTQAAAEPILGLQAEATLPPAEGTALLPVETNFAEWTASVLEGSEWLSASFESFEALKLSVAENVSPQARTATVRLEADSEKGKISAMLSVTQEGVRLTISPAETISFRADGDTVTITVSSNCPWTLEAPSWATATPAAGAAGDTTVTLRAKKSVLLARRAGEFVFSYGASEKASLAVEQEAGASSNVPEEPSDPEDPEAPVTPEKPSGKALPRWEGTLSFATNADDDPTSILLRFEGELREVSLGVEVVGMPFVLDSWLICDAADGSLWLEAGPNTSGNIRETYVLVQVRGGGVVAFPVKQED